MMVTPELYAASTASVAALLGAALLEDWGAAGSVLAGLDQLEVSAVAAHLAGIVASCWRAEGRSEGDPLAPGHRWLLALAAAH
jgi:hypothetical protein